MDVGNLISGSGSDGKASAYNAGGPGSISYLGNLLEKEMATHYSILACKMPWMEEPGRLQSMGLQRVSCNGATSVRPSFCSSVKPCLKAITFTNIIEKISRTKNS